MTPFNPDTNGDGIGDGAEAKFVVALLDASGMALNLSLIGAVLHSRDYDNDGIPNIYCYNASDRFHCSDTDGDHIPDAVESMLNNASHFLKFYNFTHRDEWMSEARYLLWDEYSRAIAYYLSINFCPIIHNTKLAEVIRLCISHR